MGTTINVCSICQDVASSNEPLDDFFLVLNIPLESRSDRNIGCKKCIEKLTNLCEFKLSCLVGEKDLLGHTAPGVSRNTVFYYMCGKSKCRFCKQDVCFESGRYYLLPEALVKHNLLGIVENHLPEIDIKEEYNCILCLECKTKLHEFQDLLKLTT